MDLGKIFKEELGMSLKHFAGRLGTNYHSLWRKLHSHRQDRAFWKDVSQGLSDIQKTIDEVKARADEEANG